MLAVCIPARPGRNEGISQKAADDFREERTTKGETKPALSWRRPTNNSCRAGTDWVQFYPLWPMPFVHLGCFWLSFWSKTCRSAELSVLRPPSSPALLFNKAHLEGRANKGGATCGFWNSVPSCALAELQWFIQRGNLSVILDARSALLQCIFFQPSTECARTSHQRTMWFKYKQDWCTYVCIDIF